MKVVFTQGKQLEMTDAEYEAYKAQRQAGKPVTPGVGVERKQYQPANAEEVKRRFGICKDCPDSSESGAKCKHHKGCCFGRWRTRQDAKCSQGRW